MARKRRTAGRPGRLLWIGLVLPLWAGAQTSDDLLPDQGGPLIPAYQGGLRMESPGTEAEEARCRDLSRRIRELEGKPLRQSTLVEEYQAGCQGGGGVEAAPGGGGLQ